MTGQRLSGAPLARAGAKSNPDPILAVLRRVLPQEGHRTAPRSTRSTENVTVG